MDKRRTIFPGTAGDASWRNLEDSSKTTLKRSIDSPADLETKVLKKQVISPTPPKSRAESGSLLTKTKEHAKSPPSVKTRILPPTFGRLASLLPVLSESPWSKYRAILTEEQGGDATVAHSIEASFELVVVRCLNNTSLQRHGGNLKNTSHANLVPLYHAFQHDESFYFVYSPMSVPLAALQCIAEGGFEGFEVAAVCKEVLNGLHYIHTNLEISYGLLGSENILLDSRANVKLANIGETMLNRTRDKQKDVSDLGILASKLSKGLHNDADKLVSGSDIHDFVALTKSINAAELQEHSFLKLSPGPACLIPRVTVAERQWFRNWAIQENEDRGQEDSIFDT